MLETENWDDSKPHQESQEDKAEKDISARSIFLGAIRNPIVNFEIICL